MSALTTLRAQVRHRLLLSYRVEPSVAQGFVPAPLRPQLVEGFAVAGVCVIALENVRPGWVRPALGLRTTNVAHRIAVEWDEDGRVLSGVYVPHRHSSGAIPALLGGIVFPGAQTRAHVSIEASSERLRATLRHADETMDATVTPSRQFSSALFPTAEAASEFHRRGVTGWSPRRNGRGLESVRLTSEAWSARGARIEEVRSTFFDRLPAGSAVPDSALVMSDVPFLWRSGADLPSERLTSSGA